MQQLEKGRPPRTRRCSALPHHPPSLGGHREEARLPARSASELPLSPRAAPGPPTLGVRMCSMARRVRRPRGRASRTCASLRRGGRGAGRGLRGKGRARSWLRPQVHRRPREAGVRGRCQRGLRALGHLPACRVPPDPGCLPTPGAARSRLRGAAAWHCGATVPRDTMGALCWVWPLGAEVGSARRSPPPVGFLQGAPGWVGPWQRALQTPCGLVGSGCTSQLGAAGLAFPRKVRVTATAAAP